MSVELGMLVAHVPRIVHEDRVAEFQKPLVDALHKASEVLHSVKPDALVIISCHFMATFHHYVDATPRHKGILTAMECPDLISDVPYDYPGDEDLASRIVEAGKQAGLPAVAVNDPTYVWDYGTVVPLRYLIPQQDIPVIDLSVCWAASLDETYLWGETIAKAIQDSGKRVAFASSGALSHNLVRGPERMPSRSEQALDKQFIDYLMNQDFVSAKDMLPQYARIAGVESGGRHIAALLGVLQQSYKPQYWGYGQSSGSGNVVMTFHPDEAQQSNAS